MDILLYLIPLAFVIGLVWLAVFVWTLRTSQYDDMEGAARRILIEDAHPLPPAAPQTPANPTPSPAPHTSASE